MAPFLAPDGRIDVIALRRLELDAPNVVLDIIERVKKIVIKKMTSAPFEVPKQEDIDKLKELVKIELEIKKTLSSTVVGELKTGQAREIKKAPYLKRRTVVMYG